MDNKITSKHKNHPCFLFFSTSHLFSSNSTTPLTVSILAIILHGSHHMSRRPATSKAKKQGEFLDKWVKYDGLLHQVHQHNTVQTLKKQMFRFGLFFPLVMANVLINTQINFEYDISNSLTETLVDQHFLRPGKLVDGQAKGFMKFDDISSHSDFWAVSLFSRFFLCETYISLSISCQVNQPLHASTTTLQYITINSPLYIYIFFFVVVFTLSALSPLFHVFCIFLHISLLFLADSLFLLCLSTFLCFVCLLVD